MHPLFTAIWDGIRLYVWHVFYAVVFCSLLELIWSANNYSKASRVRGAIFWFIYIFITATTLAVFNYLWIPLGLHPLITIPLDWLSSSEHLFLKTIGWFIAAVAAMTLGEFFYYWFHRLQHSSPLLWKFHGIHHSIREMSAVNCNHHFTEEIFRIPFVTLPISLFLQPNPGYVPAIIYTVLRIQGIYEHSASTFNLGVFRYIIADNKFHRIHHSIESHHWDKNFGSFTPFWDMVFGTAWFPQKNEWPNVGLSEVDEPKTVSEFLWRPFRSH